MTAGSASQLKAAGTEARLPEPSLPESWPLTSAGGTVAVVTVGAYLTGWQLGWVEMMMLACAGLTSLTLAGLWVIGRYRVTITRRVGTSRVTVGDPISTEVDIANTARTPAGPRTLVEQIQIVTAQGSDSTVTNSPVEVPVPALGVGESWTALVPVPTDRRGIVQLGPSQIAKSDPLNLIRRSVGHSDIDTLVIQPRVVPLAPVPVGRARHLEGATTDSSPAGDVSFHTLRGYQAGDDPRHIHWMSSARTGELVVRHYVDNRVPELTIVLDTAAARWDEMSFEVGVEVAASIAMCAATNHQPFSLFFGSVAADSRSGSSSVTGPAVAGPALDALAGVGTTNNPSSLSSVIDDASTAQPSSALTIVITGSATSEELVRIDQSRLVAAATVVRVNADASATQGAASPGTASVLDVTSLQTFRHRWNRMMA